jgi:hypothetical protein
MVLVQVQIDSKKALHAASSGCFLVLPDSQSSLPDRRLSPGMRQGQRREHTEADAKAKP